MHFHRIQCLRQLFYQGIFSRRNCSHLCKRGTGDMDKYTTYPCWGWAKCHFVTRSQPLKNCFESHTQPTSGCHFNVLRHLKMAAGCGLGSRYIDQNYIWYIVLSRVSVSMECRLYQNFTLHRRFDSKWKRESVEMIQTPICSDDSKLTETILTEATIPLLRRWSTSVQRISYLWRQFIQPISESPVNFLCNTFIM